MTLPNVSIVVPAFNAEKTLAESIDSIFTGNFTPGDEVIIVNDTSTDKTENVIEALQVKYPGKIVYLKNSQNKGCPATRNVGISAAKNPLIFNLDADNVLHPGSLATLIEHLTKEHADLATFATYKYFVDSTSYITHYWHCHPGWCTLPDLFAGHINPGPGGNFLYTKASWERIGGYWEYGKGLHEAWGFTLKQLAAGSKMFVVPNTFYYHRHGHESLFVSESKNKPGELELLKKMLAPYQSLFSQSEWTYMQEHDEWYHTLDKRPVTLLNAPLGKNGTFKLTFYGLFCKLRNRLSAV